MFGKPMYPGETCPQIGLATGKTPALPKCSSKGDNESILPLIMTLRCSTPVGKCGESLGPLQRYAVDEG
eukprot:scaffold8784_cov144-Skeletonema_marinoi.AAC.3